MQYESNETNRMAGKLCNMLKERFGDKVSRIGTLKVIDDPNWREFSIEFEAYNYFPIRLNYDRGSFGCCIDMGEIGIRLESSQKWWDTADFDVFFDDLERELELRIPDKFLKAKGWYKKPKGLFKD